MKSNFYLQTKISVHNLHCELWTDPIFTLTRTSGR
jgi:hypothetical protein